MPTRQIQIGEVVVTQNRTPITHRHVFSAWELTVAGEHATVTILDGTHYGRIDTRWPPVEFAALPQGTIRLRAVGAWQQSQNMRATAYILAAYPEVLDLPHIFDGGSVIVDGEHF